MKASSDTPTDGTPLRAGDGARPSVFVTTHWSVVLTAGRRDTTRATAALEQLCRSYWHPLYHYVRRRGFTPEDAQDLTQEFFARFLERDAIAAADPKRGRFRSFLLGSLKHFLADEWDKARAQKRGGGRVLPVDFQAEETRLRDESIEHLAPDKAYDRRWAVALLEQVYRLLEEEARGDGKAEQFAVLRGALMGGRGAVPSAEMAAQLGISEGAVRVAVHRLRQRYREVLRALIADTVADPAEVEAEFRDLIEALSN